MPVYQIWKSIVDNTSSAIKSKMILWDRMKHRKQHLTDDESITQHFLCSRKQNNVFQSCLWLNNEKIQDNISATSSVT